MWMWKDVRIPLCDRVSPKKSHVESSTLRLTETRMDNLRPLRPTSGMPGSSGMSSRLLGDIEQRRTARIGSDTECSFLSGTIPQIWTYFLTLHPVLFVGDGDTGRLGASPALVGFFGTLTSVRITRCPTDNSQAAQETRQSILAFTTVVGPAQQFLHGTLVCFDLILRLE